jgi:hypothetical protein
MVELSIDWTVKGNCPDCGESLMSGGATFQPFPEDAAKSCSFEYCNSLCGYERMISDSYKEFEHYDITNNVRAQRETARQKKHDLK